MEKELRCINGPAGTGDNDWMTVGKSRPASAIRGHKAVASAQCMQHCHYSGSGNATNVPVLCNQYADVSRDGPDEKSYDIRPVFVFCVELLWDTKAAMVSIKKCSRGCFIIL